MIHTSLKTLGCYQILTQVFQFTNTFKLSSTQDKGGTLLLNYEVDTHLPSLRGWKAEST